MADGFKETLSQINRLMWITLSLSVSLLLLKPTTQSLSVLGFTVDVPRLLIVVPLALVGLLIAKQVLIRNAAQIIRLDKKRSELKEIVLSYPIIEFMRWKFRAGSEVVLLSIFQGFIDVFPAISLSIFWSILTDLGITVPLVFKFSNFLLILLGIWNYSTLRRQVYEPLAGKIGTPD
jgi:hypothetical protein